MDFKFTAIIAAWLFIAPILLHAQTSYSLKGTITTAAGRPMEGAAILLTRYPDSALVKSAISDSTGAYIFTQVKSGSYHLTISMVGYNPLESPVLVIGADTVLAAFKLVQKETILQTVTVATQKPLMEHLIDRTVINVDALIGAAGSTVLDVLEKSPGVSVDQNNLISLQGKSGVKIYIDDRPTYLSGDDLANYLRSLPSSTIDRIELMTNPPSKYDAEGNSGIINIHTKRIRQKGFNGTLNAAFGQGIYTRTNNSLNLNYRQNKLNIAASMGYILGNTFNDISLNRYFDQSITGISPNFMQSSFIKRHSDSYSTRLGIDYYSSEKTTLGMVVSGLLTTGNNHTNNTSFLTSAQNQLDSTIVADNTENRRFENGSINLNYRRQYDKKGTEHTIDLDFITYRTQTNQRFYNTSYYPNGILYDSTLETGSLPATIHIFSAKTDYSHPLKDGIMLGAGLKSSVTQTDNTADYFTIVNEVPSPDYDQTNHFIYKENINAAYINVSKDFTRLTLQAGLRFENTIANGHQLGNAEKPDSSFTRNYNGLFPTFYMQYKLDSSGKELLQFNYGRRVDRPYYANLNPFLSPLDKFTYNAGNPFLLPTYSDNFEGTYVFKNISATLYYSYIKDKIDGLVQIINGYYYSRPGNVGNTYVKGVEVNADLDPADWFNIHLYTRVRSQHTVSSFYTGTLDTKGTDFFIRPILTIKPGKDWVFQLDGYYQTKTIIEQFIDAPKKAMNAAVSKKLSAKTTIKFVFNDIFYTQNNSWQIRYLAGTQANYYSVNDSRNFVLFFSYRFGKAISGQRKHEANGAQSEQNRVN